MGVHSLILWIKQELKEDGYNLKLQECQGEQHTQWNNVTNRRREEGKWKLVKWAIGLLQQVNLYIDKYKNNIQSYEDKQKNVSKGPFWGKKLRVEMGRTEK